MEIEVYCLANNEERLMPYIMRHYNQFAKVILLESNSTDNTVDIAKSLGAEVRSFEQPDEINDQWFTDIKNTAWQGSKADWIIVVDADEFVYHPNITEFLSETKYTCFLPSFYNMYSYKFPITDGQIYEEVTLGTRWGGEQNIYGKVNVFRLPAIKEINYNIGCHHANPKGDVKLCITDEIRTLHMRNLSKKFTVDRVMSHAKRLSDLNKKNGWGWHLSKPASEFERLWEEEISQATKIM